ncbi:MAG: terminase [Bacteroidales bacterium]|nr:terminase [Bacteroidales bacterium]
MNRPDFSDYLVHFSTDEAPKGGIDGNPVGNISALSAKDRIISILNEKTIRASSMPWTGAKAVCFIECPWSSLLAHTQVYSPYGVGFTKKTIFSQHVGPAIYIRTDVFNKQKNSGAFAGLLWSFITPFSPAYRPYSMKKAKYDIGTCDYTHEREWRTPHDFKFEYNQIEFVILNSHSDLVDFPENLKNEIGIDKFIIMDNYKFVETLWPVHKI